MHCGQLTYKEFLTGSSSLYTESYKVGNYVHTYVRTEYQVSWSFMNLREVSWRDKEIVFKIVITACQLYVTSQLKVPWSWPGPAYSHEGHSWKFMTIYELSWAVMSGYTSIHKVWSCRHLSFNYLQIIKCVHDRPPKVNAHEIVMKIHKDFFATYRRCALVV